MEVDFRVETTKPTVKVVKRDRERETRISRSERALLYLLIEKDVNRAKVIIEKILLSKRAVEY